MKRDIVTVTNDPKQLIDSLFHANSYDLFDTQEDKTTERCVPLSKTQLVMFLGMADTNGKPIMRITEGVLTILDSPVELAKDGNSIWKLSSTPHKDARNHLPNNEQQT